MGKRKSFTEYIRENFENEIYQSVEEYYNANKERLNITSYRFYEIMDTYLDDVSIRYVNAEDCNSKSMEIKFYPIVVATINIEGKTKYDMDTDSKELWLRLYCSGNLAVRLKDFQISKIEEDIADGMLVNERTVRRILDSDNGTSIENIIALCAVLKLPPMLTFNVIQKSPAKLRIETPEGYALYTLIYTTVGQSIGQVRKRAKELGISGI